MVIRSFILRLNNMNPTIKKEVESSIVTFIATFVMTIVPMVQDHYYSTGAITWSLVASFAAAALRAAVKVVYTKIISDYTQK
jgi:hypothetical protein